MKFLDEAKIYIQSGSGGNGCLSFRRERNLPFGGPNGGDGGRGGDVIVTATDSLNTLIDFRYRQHYKAGKGEHGMGSQMHGANGEDCYLTVPIGTQIFDEETDELLADLTDNGQQLVLLKGGRGGLGNIHFKTSVNRAPRIATPGEPGEERTILLRLKLLSDAGLVGLPNAGKSTFLSAVSRARPKIADYPFTTLTPQLGVVHVDEKEFVLADLPGLIEGASQGVGLGDRFLGHVERCGVLLHLLDATQEDMLHAYDVIMGELEDYGEGVPEKPMLLAMNKCDALDAETIAERKAALEAHSGQTVYAISALRHADLQPLLRAMLGYVLEHRAALKQARLEADETTTDTMAQEVSAWDPLA